MSIDSSKPLEISVISPTISMSFSQVPPSPAQYYRKPLPSQNTALCSNDGKILFREALLAGDMECYFGLASQFITQAEPAFCGLSTLVMVLNTLEVDPQRVWKAPWRWYYENMLDCCVPLEIVEKTGITFDQFVCLALCNTLEVKAFRADKPSKVDKFRHYVQECCGQTDKILVVSYSRKILGQTGTGHFSPIGGYHRDKDLVLILDVARFKYPPHWVPLKMLYEAMEQLDPDTGLSRGFIILSKRCVVPTVMFRFSNFASVTGSQSNLDRLLQCDTLWNEFLSKSLDILLQENSNKSHEGSLSSTLEESQKSSESTDEEWFLNICVERLVAIHDLLGSDFVLLEQQLDVTCPSSDLSELHCCSALDTVAALQQLPVGDVVRRWVNQNAANDTVEIPENFSAISCYQSVLGDQSLSDSVLEVGGDVNSLIGIRKTDQEPSEMEYESLPENAKEKSEESQATQSKDEFESGSDLNHGDVVSNRMHSSPGCCSAKRSRMEGWRSSVLRARLSDSISKSELSVDSAAISRWHYFTALLLLWPYDNTEEAKESQVNESEKSKSGESIGNVKMDSQKNDLKPDAVRVSHNSNNNSNQPDVIPSSNIIGDQTAAVSVSSNDDVKTTKLIVTQKTSVDASIETVGGKLSKMMDEQLSNSDNKLLQNEIMLLKQQLSSVLFFLKNCSRMKNLCQCSQMYNRK